MGIEERATTSDVNVRLPFGDAFALRAILERDRLARQKDGGSVRQVDKLIEQVERALFPRSRA